MSIKPHTELWQPWAGWIGGAAGWFSSQQLGSNLAHGACEETGPFVLVLIGLAGLALAGLGLFFSLPAWRRKAPPLVEPSPGPRAFIAACGAGAALIFAAAIVFQTISAFFIPRCFS
jgi:hypothetical protein